jgi:UDP-N-acetyl-D-mannosaminuronic acid transferase (WecB/TagA/CpsF family)
MAVGVKRIHILGIPIDVVDEENLPEVIESFYGIPDHRQIILLDFHELMRARHNAVRRGAVTQAALVIPVSKTIVRAAKFLKKDVPPFAVPTPSLSGCWEYWRRRTVRSIFWAPLCAGFEKPNRP